MKNTQINKGGAVNMRLRRFERVSEEAILANLTRVKEEGKPNVFASDRVIMPLRGTKHSAGYDIFNPIPQDIVIPPNKKVLIWTNIKVFMQEEEVLMAVVRSSMGIKLDLTLANTLGIIDMDYYNNPKNEGNIGICLKNTGDEDVIIKYGDAIGQVIFLPYLVSDNCNTDKDRVGGIGSTTKIN